MAKQVYVCPLQETAFPLCNGCPFLSEESGTYYCHLATPNFMFEGKICDIGVFPLIYPTEVYKAEIRFLTGSDGEAIAQLNVAEIEKLEPTSQDAVSDVMSKIAMDALPKFTKRKKRR